MKMFDECIWYRCRYLFLILTLYLPCLARTQPLITPLKSLNFHTEKKRSQASSHPQLQRFTDAPPTCSAFFSIYQPHESTRLSILRLSKSLTLCWLNTSFLYCTHVAYNFHITSRHTQPTHYTHIATRTGCAVAILQLTLKAPVAPFLKQKRQCGYRKSGII